MENKRRGGLLGVRGCRLKQGGQERPHTGGDWTAKF